MKSRSRKIKDLSTSFNVKLPINITNKSLNALVTYFKGSGYEVIKKVDGDFVTYLTDAPGYEMTPLIEQYGGSKWFFIRIPKKLDF